MTVLEAMHPDQDPLCCGNPHALFARAAFCGRYAKLTRGEARRILYLCKNECLEILLTRFPNEIELRGDCDRHRGLLSIALKINRRQRLHSHEAWMPAA